jgi:hypothetical protein
MKVTGIKIHMVQREFFLTIAVAIKNEPASKRSAACGASELRFSYTPRQNPLSICVAEPHFLKTDQKDNTTTIDVPANMTPTKRLMVFVKAR